MIYMAFVVHQEKEIRVPGGAIPEGKRREGVLGKLDAMPFSEFKKMNLYEMRDLLNDARLAKTCETMMNALLTGKNVEKVTTYISSRTLKKEAKQTFPVVSGRTEKQTVIFVLPEPPKECRYIVAYENKDGKADTEGMEYIIALPDEHLIRHHKDMLKYLAAAKGYGYAEFDKKFVCIGGGEIEWHFTTNGIFDAVGTSGTYGVGPHEKVQKLINGIVDENLTRLIKFYKEQKIDNFGIQGLRVRARGLEKV